MERRIYSVSPSLRAEVRDAEERVRGFFRGEVALSEYITLPEAGQHVVLRFSLRKEISGPDEIDEIENELSRLVGEGFWAVLVGEVYSGMDPALPLSEMPDRLEELARKLERMPLPVSSSRHAPSIRRDAQIVRSRLRLASNDWVWEIEAPWSDAEARSLVRIVSEEVRDDGIAVIDGREFSVEYVPPNDGYEALVKAYPLARRAGKALVRYVFDCTGEALLRPGCT